MADPTQPKKQKFDPTQPWSKNIDSDPSLQWNMGIIKWLWLDPKKGVDHASTLPGSDYFMVTKLEECYLLFDGYSQFP